MNNWLSENIMTIFFSGLILFVIALGLIQFFKDNENKKRAKEVILYAKRNKLTIKPYFSKFIKEFGGLRCFLEMIDPNFCNVIEKLDKENGDVYIGDLQWEIAVERQQRHRRRGLIDLLISSGGAGENRYIRVKKETTLCVLYDDGFKLPDFDLSRETLKEKAIEVLHMNETEDIDFDDDKEFSSAWWLSSNENMIVRELFTRNIRSNFMSFVDKGYRICGKANVLFIITDKPLWPQDYSKLTSDIRMIQRFMKNNKKFYTPYSEREKQPDNN